jgi:hypothetical protein
VASISPLSLHSNTSHKFYTIINGVGGIAVAKVYSMDFDNDGIRTMITHVPFNQHKLFTTHQESWTFFVAFFPHIKSPNEATFMNENCPSSVDPIVDLLPIYCIENFLVDLNPLNYICWHKLL